MRNEIKEQMKTAGVSIAELRRKISTGMRNNEPVWKLQYQIIDAKYQYRHMHIAYSMLLGTEYKDIEKTTKEGNAPNWELVDKYTQEFSD